MQQQGEVLVRIDKADASTYPDAMVICGPPHYAHKGSRIIDNPIVLVEVLSPSTASDDRETKFATYPQLESLRQYVLISQDEPR